MFTPHSLTPSSCIDAPTLVQAPLPPSDLPNVIPPSNITHENLFSAFSSPTAGLLTCWHFSGSKMKTKDETMCLARKYMQDPTFNPSELSSYSIDRECKLIQKYLENDSNSFHAQNSWFHLSFNLCINKEGVKFTSEMDPTIPTIPIKNIIYCSITHIMKTVLSNTISSTFYLTPFKQYWTTADGCNIRVHSECFTSPRMLNAYEEINSLLRKLGDE